MFAKETLNKEPYRSHYAISRFPCRTEFQSNDVFMENVSNHIGLIILCLEWFIVLYIVMCRLWIFFISSIMSSMKIFWTKSLSKVDNFFPFLRRER